MRAVDRAIGVGKLATQAAWQVSAVPVQALGRRAPATGTLPFYALAATTAAVGLVDWPVALLVAGAVLVARRTGAAPGEPTATIDTPRTAPAPADGAPWAGYDEATAAQVISALEQRDGDPERVLSYERAHRDRKTVTAAATRVRAEHRGHQP